MQKSNNSSGETVESFLKRGGKITKIPTGVGVGFKPSNTISGNRRRQRPAKQWVMFWTLGQTLTSLSDEMEWTPAEMPPTRSALQS